MSDFIEMGGHGVYIWPCYLMAFVLFVGIFLESFFGLKKSRKDLEMLEKMNEQENAEQIERQAS